MADQGCPNEGRDSRLFGRWGCRVQSALSFRTRWSPIRVLFCFPFWFGLSVPLSVSPPRFASLRVGFRWDGQWLHEDGVSRGGYIFPEAILKVTDHNVVGID
jgi:hypothetical protein